MSSKLKGRDNLAIHWEQIVAYYFLNHPFSERALLFEKLNRMPLKAAAKEIAYKTSDLKNVVILQTWIDEKADKRNTQQRVEDLQNWRKQQYEVKKDKRNEYIHSLIILAEQLDIAELSYNNWQQTDAPTKEEAYEFITEINTINWEKMDAQYASMLQELLKLRVETTKLQHAKAEFNEISGCFEIQAEFWIFYHEGYLPHVSFANYHPLCPGNEVVFASGQGGRLNYRSDQGLPVPVFCEVSLL